MLNNPDPIFKALEEILNQHKEGISEFELLKLIKSKGYFLDGEEILFNNLAMFQTHFSLFHLLYLLRERFLIKKKAVLEIHCLKIQLKPYIATKTSQPEVKDPLSEYYLDLNNLKETTEKDVDEMLKKFWRDYTDHHQKKEAFERLGLMGGESSQEVKKRYRELARLHHPDKGGDPKRFRQISEAVKSLLN